MRLLDDGRAVQEREQRTCCWAAGDDGVDPDVVEVGPRRHPAGAGPPRPGERHPGRGGLRRAARSAAAPGGQPFRPSRAPTPSAGWRYARVELPAAGSGPASRPAGTSTSAWSTCEAGSSPRCCGCGPDRRAGLPRCSSSPASPDRQRAARRAAPVPVRLAVEGLPPHLAVVRAQLAGDASGARPASPGSRWSTPTGRDGGATAASRTNGRRGRPLRLPPLPGLSPGRWPRSRPRAPAAADHRAHLGAADPRPLRPRRPRPPVRLPAPVLHRVLAQRQGQVRATAGASRSVVGGDAPVRHRVGPSYHGGHAVAPACRSSGPVSTRGGS